MEDKMPLVGLCGEPKEALEKIEYMMQAAFPAGAVFGRRSSPGGKKQTDRVCADHGKICGSVGSSGLSDLVGQL